MYSCLKKSYFFIEKVEDRGHIIDECLEQAVIMKEP